MRSWPSKYHRKGRIKEKIYRRGRGWQETPAKYELLEDDVNIAKKQTHLEYSATMNYISTIWWNRLEITRANLMGKTNTLVGEKSVPLTKRLVSIRNRTLAGRGILSKTRETKTLIRGLQTIMMNALHNSSKGEWISKRKSKKTISALPMIP